MESDSQITIGREDKKRDPLPGGEEIIVSVDVTTDSNVTTNSNVSVIKIVTVSSNDTIYNKEITIEGESPNIDSIINAAKSAAVEANEEGNGIIDSVLKALPPS